MSGLTRRDLLATGAALGAVTGRRAPAVSTGARPTAVVVGAGAFGGWSALHLLRRGFDVTLLDAWSAGHSRSSSGGETRVIRLSYGNRGIYTRLTARSLELWRELERERATRLFDPRGVLFLFGANDEFVRESAPHLTAAGARYEVVDATEGAKRWPQIAWDGVRSAIWEPDSGGVFARRACAEVAAAFAEEGGRLVHAAARPQIDADRGAVVLDDGSRLDADQIVFACGPWLRELFPELLGEVILPSRQEVLYFGTPAGDDRYEPGRLPVWADFTGLRLFYGIPGNEARGFKVADDTRGTLFDPTSGDRTPTSLALGLAREFLARRFPPLATAPLVEARVCQYENSPDGHLIFARHPEAANLWILGGGSGHGFKLSPALGEQVAATLAGVREPEPTFALSRFAPSATG